MTNTSFLQIAGAIPFSSFGGKRKVSRRNNTRRTNKRKRISNKRKSKRKRISNKRKRISNKRTNRKNMNKCICNKKKTYKKNKDSPEGLGYCSSCTPNNIVMKGKDGNLWENINKKWVLIRKDMRGGFIRAGTI